ncbi:hypothetical protein [uncultured Psychroserpens sp.]|uniref:hypothetical protein n=1 Tax=uncultured Psychroserpens sp. TaxID=255436 RepID=UPI0026171DE3|nr:hypothetical protein [uncultured Psychroserpens sp.]
MYFKYNEELPTGSQGQAADQLAIKMLDALNHEAYKATDYIEFTFKKRHHYKWIKAENTCEVYWKNIMVHLDLANHDNSLVTVSNEPYTGEDVDEYINKALDLFNNDTFWLVAPYKVFDPGVERRLVTTENDKEALLVTYTDGGSTPGDSYLWHFDNNGKPKSYQMWVDILPIDGLEASWTDWTTTDTGAQLPTFHKLLFMGLEIEDIKTSQLLEKKLTSQSCNCIYEGDNTDINIFLNVEAITEDNKLTVLGNIFNFTNHEASIIYEYDSENSTLSTSQPKSISAQIEPYRRYSAEIKDSTATGFKMEISSKGEHHTKMNRTILLDCRIINKKHN